MQFTSEELKIIYSALMFYADDLMKNNKYYDSDIKELMLNKANKAYDVANKSIDMFENEEN